MKFVQQKKLKPRRVPRFKIIMDTDENRLTDEDIYSGIKTLQALDRVINSELVKVGDAICESLASSNEIITSNGIISKDEALGMIIRHPAIEPYVPAAIIPNPMEVLNMESNELLFNTQFPPNGKGAKTVLYTYRISNYPKEGLFVLLAENKETKNFELFGGRVQYQLTQENRQFDIHKDETNELRNLSKDDINNLIDNNIIRREENEIYIRTSTIIDVKYDELRNERTWTQKSINYLIRNGIIKKVDNSIDDIINRELQEEFGGSDVLYWIKWQGIPWAYDRTAIKLGQIRCGCNVDEIFHDNDEIKSAKWFPIENVFNAAINESFVAKDIYGKVCSITSFTCDVINALDVNQHIIRKNINVCDYYLPQDIKFENGHFVYDDVNGNLIRTTSSVTLPNPNPDPNSNSNGVIEWIECPLYIKCYKKGYKYVPSNNTTIIKQYLTSYYPDKIQLSKFKPNEKLEDLEKIWINEKGYSSFRVLEKDCTDDYACQHRKDGVCSYNHYAKGKGPFSDQLCVNDVNQIYSQCR